MEAGNKNERGEDTESKECERGTGKARGSGERDRVRAGQGEDVMERALPKVHRWDCLKRREAPWRARTRTQSRDRSAPARTLLRSGQWETATSASQCEQLPVLGAWTVASVSPHPPCCLTPPPSTSPLLSRRNPPALPPHMLYFFPISSSFCPLAYSCLCPLPPPSLLPRPPVCPPTFLFFLSRTLAIPWHCHPPTQQFLLITQTPRSPPWAYFWLPPGRD
ncbi:hypothetical protein Q5P01_010438 [Channa striata]|uniref:Uncharacterized protein n=1 Tax=Channa striata TaxID=64152 RepID=A0AA88MXS6_CHASR|nr:hypothetical protein Q5P01_010438 [Channa striata]